MSSINENLPVNGSSNTRLYNMPTAGLADATLVPAAVSVQIMNPEAIQTSSGIVFIGRAPAQIDWVNSGNTWRDKGEQFISFGRPRLCAAGKLALRGVQVDAVPFNMNALADFRPYESKNDGSYTWGTSGKLASEGFGPIVVVNPNRIDLQYLVTIEYRVRFAMSNSATATHSTHHPASDATWSHVLKVMASEAHGVLDIPLSIASGMS
jgi:hypothetical protein